MGKVIAITGKGGTGKTALAAMLIRHLLNKGKKGSILVIDADPDANLSETLGVRVNKTVGEAREYMQEARFNVPPDYDKQKLFQAKLFEVLHEEDGYDLLVMGRSEGSGCYCFVNSLLKGIMDETIEDYDVVIIDTPAGLEHISRKTISDLDFLIVVTDASKRGLTTAERIRELAKEIELGYKNLYVVANKVDDKSRDQVVKNASGLNLKVIGIIPYDENLARFDLVGDPLINLPDDSPAIVEVEEHIVNEIGI